MLTSQTLLNTVTAPNQVTGATSLSQLGEDYDSFLTLLTAQIQNQDPLSPVDSTEFVAQLAQLTQVEQAVQTNTQIETLNAQVAALMNLSGTDLIGRQVRTNSDRVVLQDGAINATYAVEPGAESVEARFFDPTGRQVFRIQGLGTEAGVDTPLTWDGRDNDGNPQLEGTYRVQLIALDAEGAPVTATLSRIAEVQEVIFKEGEILFTVTCDEDVSSVTVLSAS